MSLFQDLVVDLLNQAKETGETQKKLFLLEQVKEIVLHRDSTLLADILPEVLELMLERSVQIRRFLIQLGGEAIGKSALTIPTVLSMFAHLVMENNESLLRSIAGELGKVYGKIVLFIVGLPQRTKAQVSAGQLDPKLVWGDFKNISRVLEETVASDRSEECRAQCVRFMEEIVLFGLQVPPPSSDPRLARSQKQAQSNKDSSSAAADIPLTHPFISRNDIEQEAEASFSKFLLWASKAAAANFPFGPLLISQLGQSIAAVATSRPKKASNAATALTNILQGKSSLVQGMTVPSRDLLARAVQRLLRVATAHFGADPEGIVAKLKSSLSNVTIASENDAAEAESSLGKRPLGDEAEGEGAALLALKASAVQAVDALENEIKTKAARPAEVEHAPAAVAPTAVAEKEEADTELCPDLAEFPEPSQLRLASLPPGTLTASGPSVLRVAPPMKEGFEELAMQSLRGVLDGLAEMKSYGSAAVLAQSKLAVRMAVSMSLVDLAADKFGVSVIVISSLSPLASMDLLDGVAKEVNLPRPMWMLLGFILTVQHEDIDNALARLRSAQKGASQRATLAEKTDMLMMLLEEVRSRSEGEGSMGDDHMRNPCHELFESLFVTVLSRLLQNIYLRPVAKRVLHSLPLMPQSALRLLRLLTLTGSRAAAATALSRKPSGGLRNRGVRTEARELLEELVFGSDEDAATFSLNTLLWCSVSDDFETRDRTVKDLIGRVAAHSSWAYEAVALFAVHSAMNLVGFDAAQARAVFRQEQGSEVVVDVKMEVEEVEEKAAAEKAEEDNKAEGEEVPMTLTAACESFDGGQCFGGSFNPLSKEATSESSLRKALHLLLQLSVAFPSFLVVLLDVFAASAAAAAAMPEDSVQESSSTHALLTKVLTAELATIVPAIMRKRSAELVFSQLVRCDPLARPLVQHTLQLLFADPHVPATAHIIESVKSYIGRFPVQDGAAPLAVAEEGSLLNGVDLCSNLGLLLPLLGGLPACDVTAALPRLLQLLLAESTDALKAAFSRITQARPPPLSKVSLLSLLHRIDFDAHGIPQKLLADGIGVCINNREEFKSDTMRDALTELVGLEPVPNTQLIMRTAILSSQLHGEVKKYLLGSMVPALIRKKVWSGAPQVWKGVLTVFMVKINLVRDAKDLKDAEPALRSLLGLPAPQLKAVLKDAGPNVRLLLAQVLKVLSAAERADVVGGKWAGIAAPVDAEKDKIIKEISALTTAK